MLLLFIDTKCTIYIGIDIMAYLLKKLADYQSFFLMYYLKSWKTVQISAMNKTYIKNSRILNKASIYMVL